MSYGGVSSLQEFRRNVAKRELLRSVLLVVLAVCLAAAMVGATLVGPSRVHVRQLVRLLQSPVTGTDIPAQDRRIIVQVRIPRVLMAVCVGCALAASGTAMQAMFRNPLASPQVLGVSSGAAFGAALAILLGLRIVSQLSATVFSAFCFALVPAGVVYALAGHPRMTSRASLILLGVALSAFFSGLVSFVLYLADERLQSVVFWLMGGLWHSDWTRLGFAAPFVATGVILLFLFTDEMDILAFGDRSARDLGVPVERVKKILLVGAALATAAAVSVAGVIGFVGLVVPHIGRILIGANHRYLLPFSCLAGGLLLLGVDVLCRSLIQPLEIPAGIVTALFGAPFFAALLLTKGARTGWAQ